MCMCMTCACACGMCVRVAGAALRHAVLGVQHRAARDHSSHRGAVRALPPALPPLRCPHAYSPCAAPPCVCPAPHPCTAQVPHIRCMHCAPHAQVWLRVDWLLWRLRLRGCIQVQPAAGHVRAELLGQPLQARLRDQLRRHGRRGGGGGVTTPYSTCKGRRRVSCDVGLGWALPFYVQSLMGGAPSKSVELRL